MKKLIAALVFGACAFTVVTAHAFSANTMAFYPFRDGAPGTSAVGVTVTNLIDEAVFPGRVAQVGEGDVLFSDEHPAQYVFSELYYGATCDYVNPGSLYFPKTGGKENHAKFLIDGLCKKLNELVASTGNNNAWKIEFFFKAEKDQYIGNNTDAEGQEPHFFGLDGICDNKGNANDETITHTNCDFRIRFNDNGAAYRLSPKKYGYRTSDGAYVACGNNTWGSKTTPKMNDGKWHYVSISSGYNGFAFAGRPMYASEGNNFRMSRFTNAADSHRTVYAMRDPDAAGPLLLNPNGSFHGWISCLKISTSGIVASNMQLSELETCVSRTLSHIRFEEGTPGAALANGTRLVNACNPAAWNTGISYLVDEGRGREGTGLYGMPQVVYTDEPDASVAFSGTVRRKFVLTGAEEPLANLLSGSFVGPTTNATGSTLKVPAGVGLTYPKETLMTLKDTTPLTFECFIRFDFDDWMARVAPSTNAKSVSLFFMPWAAAQLTGSSYDNTFGLSLDLSKPAAPKICVNGYAGSKSYDAPWADDGKWHHVVVAFKPRDNDDKADYKLYVDYKLVDENWTYYYEHDYNKDRNIFCLRSNQKNLHCFNGLVDELRISYGMLEPEDFLHQKNFDGVMLLVR